MIRRIVVVTLLLCSLVPGLVHADETKVEQLMASLAVLERESGPFAESMIPLLEQLGDLYLAMEDTAAAENSYQRAQHIVHRWNGVLSSAQLGLIDKMAVIAVRINDVDRSTRLQKFRHQVSVASFGVTDMRTVESLIDLVEWYQLLGRVEEAESMLRDAVDNPNLPHYALGLINTSLSYNEYLKGRCCDSARIEESLELLAAGGADQAEIAQGYQTAADLSLLAGRNHASDYYAVADSYRAEVAEAPAALGVSRIDRMVRAYLRVLPDDAPGPSASVMIPPGSLVGFPMTFCAAQLADIAEPHEWQNYYIDATLRVTAVGKATDIEIVSSNTPPALERLFRRIAGITRFRPQLDNGRTVDSTVNLHQRFSAVKNLDEGLFPPANVLAFHGCHAIAGLRTRDGDQLQIVNIQ